MNDGKDHLRALLAAYNAATGLALTLSPFREKLLRALDRRKLTPADMTAVIGELQRLIVADPRRYPETCILFTNAVANVDKFEERALVLRGKVARKRTAAKAAPAAEKTPAPLADSQATAEALRQWREGQGR